MSALGDNDYETRMFLLTTDGGSFSSTASVSVTGPTVDSTDWQNNQKGGMGIKQSANSTVELKSGASLAYNVNWKSNPFKGFAQAANSTFTIGDGASMSLSNMSATFNSYYYRNKVDRSIFSVGGTFNVKGSLNWVAYCSWQQDTPTFWSDISTNGVMNVYAGSTVKLSDLRLNDKSALNFIGNSTVTISQIDKSTFNASNKNYDGSKTIGEGLSQPYVNTYGAIVVNGAQSTIGLYGENSLSNDDSITSIGFKGSSMNLNVNVGGVFDGKTYDAKTNYLPAINAVADSSLTINIGSNPNGAFTINSIDSTATSGEFALILNNFYNDFVCFEVDYSDKLSNGLIHLDSGLGISLSGKNSSGNYMGDNWSVVEKDGMFYLNNADAVSAVPEPSVFAFVFGVFALAFAYSRRR